MNNIARTVYINLDRRPDRRAEIEQELDKIGLLGKSDRFSAISHAVPFIGCSLSHLEVVKLAKQNKWKNVLIFEDDFRFVVSTDEFEKCLTHLFNMYYSWGVVMFGYNNQKEKELVLYDKPDNFFGITNETQTASCYLVDSSYYDKLIDCWTPACDMLQTTFQHWLYMNDQSWKALQGDDRWLYTLKRTGVQRSSFSDLGGKFREESFY